MQANKRTSNGVSVRWIRTEADHVRDLANQMPLTREMALALRAYAIVLEASVTPLEVEVRAWPHFRNAPL